MAKKKSDTEEKKYITAIFADTLSRISRAYKISIKDLKALNPGITINFIRKGTEVRIK